MAREVKNTVGNNEPFPYVPDVDDNRDDPDPFVVWITCASHAEIAAQDESQLMQSMRAKGDKGAMRALKSLTGRRDKLLAARVTKVQGYATTGLAGVRRVPEDGDSLIEALDAGSANEAEAVKADIEAAILDASKASEGLLGNFSKSQPSS